MEKLKLGMAILIMCLAFLAGVFSMIEKHHAKKYLEILERFNGEKTVVCEKYVVDNKNFTLREDKKFFISNDGSVAIRIDPNRCE